MSKTLRKILEASSALLMIAGVGATAGNANASIHSRKYKTHISRQHKVHPQISHHKKHIRHKYAKKRIRRNHNKNRVHSKHKDKTDAYVTGEILGRNDAKNDMIASEVDGMKNNSLRWAQGFQKAYNASEHVGQKCFIVNIGHYCLYFTKAKDYPKIGKYPLNGHQSIAQNKREMAKRTLIDINAERSEAQDTPQLTETPFMKKLANMRANQLTKNFSHDNKKGQTYYIIDSKKLGKPLNDKNTAENIADAGIENGEIDGIDDNGHKDKKIYHNRNGYDMADADNDSMVNYDADSRDGHRDNMLQSYWKHVGVGVAYSPKDKTYYLAEDFEG